MATAFALALPIQRSIPPSPVRRHPTRLLRASASTVWRPSPSDVQRLSRGQAAKKRGTGSRAVPHRLNAEEQEAFTRASKARFLTVRGGGVRRERKGSPLVNTWRMWCDAQAVPAVFVRLARDGKDAVCMDFSTLRMEKVDGVRAAFEGVIGRCEGLEEVEWIGWQYFEEGAEIGGEAVRWDDDPTWRLPNVEVEVKCADRITAKGLAKTLAGAWEEMDSQIRSA